jgi:predicted secreted protein
MAMKGISARLQVSTTAGGAGTYTDVAEMRDVTINLGGENIDVSFFGTSAWTTRIQGRKDVTIDGSGYLVPGDTNGQVAIRNALINDTELWAKYLWDGSAGFKCQVRVATFSSAADVDGIVGLSLRLEGTSAATVV